MKNFKRITVVLAIAFWLLGFVILEGFIAQVFKVTCFVFVLCRLVTYVKYEYCENIQFSNTMQENEDTMIQDPIRNS